MPFFQYRARDKSGALVTGNLEAATEADLEANLDRMGLIPIRVTARGKTRSFSLPDFSGYFNKVSKQELIIFSRQLATLFSAGVPLTRALFTLERQAATPVFSRVVKAIREDVEAGTTFSGAIKKHPAVFTELYANMVEAGEAGGIMEGVLNRLAYMLERNAENRAKVKSATLYPKIVVAGIGIAILILMNFVVPKFAKLYQSFNVDLPLPTRVLIALSTAFADYWHVLIIFSIAVFFAFRIFIRTGRGRLLLDRASLKVPVFGPLITKSVMSRFARVLGSLYKSGLPILQSLDIVSRAVDNTLITNEIKRIEDQVRTGKSLSEELGRSGHFPPMVVQMVAVGEDTGNLDDMLDKVAEYYDQEVDTSIRNLTTTLEPILLSFIFVVVLFLALAIFLPMWDILKVVRR